MNQPIRKYYVGDEFDNFDEFTDLILAQILARKLVADGFTGVHILHLMPGEFEEYCRTGQKPNTEELEF